MPILGRRAACLLAGLMLAWAAPAPAHPDLDVLKDALDQEAARQPNGAGLYVRQAQVHRLAREWDAALVALEAAAQHGAGDDLVTAERGLVFLDAGWPAIAKLHFERVLERHPEHAAVRFARGRAWLKLGRPEDAARDFGDAIANMAQPTPDHVFARRDALLAAGQPEAALRAVDEGMARVGSVPSLQLAALDLAVTLGRRDEALRRIDALLARNPRNEAWLARRGAILAQAGRDDDARHAYREALVLIQSRPERRKGRRIDALEQELRAALATSPDSSEFFNAETPRRREDRIRE